VGETARVTRAARSFFTSPFRPPGLLACGLARDWFLNFHCAACTTDPLTVISLKPTPFSERKQAASRMERAQAAIHSIAKSSPIEPDFLPRETRIDCL